RVSHLALSGSVASSAIACGEHASLSHGSARTTKVRDARARPLATQLLALVRHTRVAPRTSHRSGRPLHRGRGLSDVAGLRRRLRVGGRLARRGGPGGDVRAPLPAGGRDDRGLGGARNLVHELARPSNRGTAPSVSLVVARYGRGMSEERALRKRSGPNLVQWRSERLEGVMKNGFAGWSTYEMRAGRAFFPLAVGQHGHTS